ncbi:sugar ABC transporter substrate-binding protein [Bifidobacterium pseudolongum subsp. globosum]|uniref:Sugar ABC transporter substrate-binding protein n=1 Tax=Bifidobacterium pseudolongum subsp. globosum TaxID=1690 RepID=A0A4Q5A0W4_9BIFI|nr:ABC transporter substrate-binding protein [Bifidobacterium pseudolongum]RYQ08486.1 sugar ABC transporter substrate-binding protein [Bifidobacterium pseudolongum subsp. globosum]
MAACGGGSDAQSKTADGKTIVKIQTFNNFGYGKSTDQKPGADLWAQYEKENPNVKVEETVASSSDEARTAFNTAISSGANTYDISAVDIAWMPSIRAMGSKFVDLAPYANDNSWPDWVKEGGTADGRMIGVGTDIGPTAMCYRKDLFEKAGLPSDRDKVKEYFGGDSASWDRYFEIGQEYTKKTGKPFIDNMGDAAAMMKMQQKEVFVSTDDKIIATDKTVHGIFDEVAENSDISAHLDSWTDDWNSAFGSEDGFATIMSPAWLLNNIKGNAGPDFRGWDIADITPGGTGADQGGSWLVVPESSPVKEEAANKKDEYFNNAPVGKIFANRAAAIKHIPYINGQYYDIDAKFGTAISRGDVVIHSKEGAS